MEAAAPVALVSPQKRPLDDEHSTPSPASTALTALSSMDIPSPLKSVSAPSSSVATSSAQQPAKRRKLTAQEKAEQQLEKDTKAKARAEKKAQKEAEDKIKAEQKAQKEEEKRIKDEEKRKKNEEKEEKKRVKELKQQQEEEEKRKKERSQMRLNAFFAKPKPTDDISAKSTVDTVQNPTTGQTFLAPEPTSTSTGANSIPPSPQKALQKNAQTDYDRYFLPFSLPPHAILAPRNAFMDKPEDLAAAQRRIDSLIAQEDVEMEPITLETFRSIFPKRRRGLGSSTIGEVVDLVNGSADHPIDLTDDRSAKSQKPLDMLKQIPMKYLHFPEDVRPPYYGTYTKPHCSQDERKLARNPISRGLPDMNYDYDSEVEWEEPEEGEDLDSDGEEDLDEDADEDMDGFLDDEDDPEVKRRLLSGDQEPLSTGLCWEDARGISRLNDGSGAISTEFKDFKMGFLLEPQPLSIDPFSTAYWAPDPAATSATTQSTAKDFGLMNPPRLPLTSRPVNGLLNTLNSSQNTQAGTAAKATKPKRMIPVEQLSAFKAEVEGQDLTKIGMIEALKKKFPKVPKDAITNTLTAVAKRVGPTEKEKRWVLYT